MALQSSNFRPTRSGRHPFDADRGATVTVRTRIYGNRKMAVNSVVESLIVLSDVHLGSDLVAASSVGSCKRSQEIDDDLTRLIDHYRLHPPARGRWRLVIAGDLIDFIGMVLPTERSDIETAPSEEERLHGLGNARDHTLAKMRAVAERHREVFDAFGRFIADGNAITIIHGNHDLELYWEDVRAELTRTLLGGGEKHAATRGHRLDRAGFLSRLEYTPWFFYRDGVAYIEHGHQYDEYCATEHLLTPLSPTDPRRVARGFCDVLLRFVVRQTPGLTEHGHEEMGIVDYLRFGRRLGAGGMAALALRFVRAIRELFRLRRAHFVEATQALRAQHEQAMARFARARKIGTRRVRALWRLQATPITKTISGIMSSLLLDRLALAAGCTMLLAAVAVLATFDAYAWVAVVPVALLWIGGHHHLRKRRKIDAVPELATRAAEVASIFDVPYVVMGHTHVPACQALPGDVTYVNVGSWAEDDGSAPRAQRAHLVIHPGEDRPIAHFLRWDRALGPTEYEAA